ncbi:enoyl-CoA hydratase/isomerase family protein [Chloroflexota bacterium]
MHSDITLKKEDLVATITLNRPEKLNAITPDMMAELNAILDDVASDDKVRVVVLTGAGRGFCAGANIGTPGVLLHEKFTLDGWRRNSISRYGRASSQLYYMEKPTIAMINGIALGTGFALAIACDIRTGSDNSRFQCGFTRVGVQPEAGADWLLTHVLGLSRAAELIFLSDFVEAEEAFRIGLLNRLFPSDKLEEETMNLARNIASMPPLAIRMGKIMLHRTLNMDLDTAIQMAHAGGAPLQATEDHHEAVDAFREKRKPVFKGK